MSFADFRDPGLKEAILIFLSLHVQTECSCHSPTDTRFLTKILSIFPLVVYEGLHVHLTSPTLCTVKRSTEAHLIF